MTNPIRLILSPKLLDGVLSAWRLISGPLPFSRFHRNHRHCYRPLLQLGQISFNRSCGCICRWRFIVEIQVYNLLAYEVELRARNRSPVERRWATHAPPILFPQICPAIKPVGIREEQAGQGPNDHLVPYLGGGHIPRSIPTSVGQRTPHHAPSVRNLGQELFRGGVQTRLPLAAHSDSTPPRGCVRGTR